MIDTDSTADYVADLDRHLRSASVRPNFDMDDAPDLAFLKPFPILHDGVAWLDTCLTELWRRADEAALKHQRRHRALARIAVATGVGAIILAIVQLALKQSWPELTRPAALIEGITVLAGVISVGVGLWAKSDRKWLGWRHRAELLRMSKFRALGRPDLWNGSEGQWKNWISEELNKLPSSDSLDDMERWSKGDTSDTGELVTSEFAGTPEVRNALVTYYRHKRLLNQADYFDRKGRAASASWTMRMRHQRERLFFVTIGFVLFHFAADYVAVRIGHGERREVAHAWELASLWSIVMAAVLPVAGMGVRAWSAVFELSRKARSFAAKHEAMHKAVGQLGAGAHTLPVVLARIQSNEIFLEQEHREWLRLMLDAEWFL